MYNGPGHGFLNQSRTITRVAAGRVSGSRVEIAGFTRGLRVNPRVLPENVKNLENRPCTGPNIPGMVPRLLLAISGQFPTKLGYFGPLPWPI